MDTGFGNLEKFRLALSSIGFSNAANSIRANSESFVRLGRDPYVLDFIGPARGATFEEIWSNAIQTTVLDLNVPIHIINLRDLRISKAASGRLKDLADLEELPEA